MAYNGDKLKTAPHHLGRFLGREEISRASAACARAPLQPRVRADGRRRQARRRLQGAGHQGRRRPRVQEARPSSSRSIQWWEAGAQPPQFLVAGDVVMTTAYNGRIDAANREGKNLKDHLDRRHLRPGLLGHPEGLAQQGRGAEVHRLRQLRPTPRPSTRRTSPTARPTPRRSPSSMPRCWPTCRPRPRTRRTRCSSTSSSGPTRARS